MKIIRIILGLTILLLWQTIAYCQNTFAGSANSRQTILPLNNLNAFENPGKNWDIASDVTMSLTSSSSKLKNGQGIVVNTVSKGNNSHLVTKQEFEDIELELDFMMAKGSNSGIYLQGRYEVQLLDSWIKLHPTFADCGGIYQRWDDSRAEKEKGFEGIAPIVNAALAPGLWQHLRIRFRAPRFNEQGEKTSNALFEEVYLNGVLVQQQMQVTGSTRSSLFDDEKPSGPLMLQGDHGNVAFRNIRYRPLGPKTVSEDENGTGAIVVKPDDKPYLLRSFMMFGDKKLDYIISMGGSQGLNYSYDLRQGAWLQVWRGGFMDATDMWHSRGEAQLARPLGSVVPFTDTPAVARLSDTNMAWPDSLAFEDLHNDGYLLDKKGVPTFKYTVNGTKVSDRISPSSDGSGLNRTLTAENPSGNLYCRVVSAHKIETVDKGLYRIDGSYYIRMDRNFKPFIRSNDQGQEMLVSLKNPGSPLTYSVIW